MAGLRRRYVPGEIEVTPGQEPLGATAEERRASPASQTLLRRADAQQQERAALAKARFEKSERGLIPAEGETEKARRRQHLIRQAGRHGVPQSVLAKQMQVEGLEPAAPSGPMVQTPHGELPADVGYRYLAKEAPPVAQPKAQWKVIKDPKSNTGYSYQNLSVPAEIRKEAPAPKKGTGPGGGGGGFKTEKDLRGEYLNITKPFRGVRDSFARVQASAKEPSAAGDLALIFNYMKMLDPASVVRESEFAQAAVTGAWGERMKAAGQKILEGERLSDAMRKDFTGRAGMLMKRQKAQFDTSKSEYTRLAKSYKVDPTRVVIDLEDPIAAGIALEQDFPDKMSQIQIARKEGYSNEEIRAFLGGQ